MYSISTCFRTRFPQIVLSVALIVLPLQLLLAQDQGFTPGSNRAVKISPVPSKGEIREAADDVEEQYDVKLRSIRRSTDLENLGKLQTALLTETDPAKRYVMLDAAITFASEAGDVTRTFDTIDLLTNEFEVDDAEITQEALETLSKVRRPAPDYYLLAIKGYEAGQQLCDDHQYEPALEFIDLAFKLARQVEETALHLQLQQFEQRWKGWSEAYDQVEKSHETVQKTDQDQQANLAWGRFLCFHKGDWKTGLPYLAKGQDRALAALAQRDLKQPKEFAEILALTEEWSRYAATQSKLEAAAIQKHAFDVGQRGFDTVDPNQLQTFERKMAQWFGATQIWKTTVGQTGIPIGGARANPGTYATVELWVRSTQSVGAVITKREKDAENAIGIEFQSGKIHCYAHGAKHGAATTSPDKYNDGHWHHLAAVKMGNRLTLFCDGQLVEKPAIINPRLVSQAPWRIGYRPVDNRWALDATYARIRISSIARYHVPFEPQLDYAPDRGTIFFK
jgi:hypothetical protein